MTQPTLRDLRDEADAIYGEYGARFAGKPRATRDLGALEALIERLERLIDQARSLQKRGQNPAISSLLEQARENLEIYDEERNNIAKTKARGPVVVQAGQLATWANLLFGQYFRHFAGKSRSTRDLGLLNEIISELEFVESQMKKVSAKADLESTRADIETVRKNLEMYRDERDHILAARESGSLEQRASQLAVVANEQFAIYNFHFGGRPRVSRRPGLLHRVVATLEAVQEEMAELDEEGLDSQKNRDNIEVIDQKLDHYGEELDQIQTMRRQTAPEELVGQLGEAANWAMAQYSEHFAGQDRASRDLELLSRICDELLEMGRQMRELDGVVDNRANEKNLTIVLDNAMLYQSEYEEIQRTQG